MNLYCTDEDLDRWADDGGAVVGRKTIVTREVELTIRSLVDQMMARCDREGIAWADFYQQLLIEQKHSPTVSPAELFARTFRRVKALTN